MRYDKLELLESAAERVSNGVAANQSRENLTEQLKDLHVLAMRFGLYDAADWLRDLLDHREQYERDYGVELTEPEGSESISLDEAIARITTRKLNLDQIYDEHSATAHAINSIREDELEYTLEVLKAVRV